MSLYGIAGLAGVSYTARPVPPVDKIQHVNSALQTKTAKAKSISKTDETSAPMVLGNGDFAIQNQTGRPAQTQSMYYDGMTQQRVWYA